MKIEQLPLFFSTSGALTKSNSSLQPEVIQNLDLSKVKAGNKHSNTPLEAPRDFFTYALVYAADSSPCSTLHTFFKNTDVDTNCKSTDFSTSLYSYNSGMGLSFFIKLLLNPLKSTQP